MRSATHITASKSSAKRASSHAKSQRHPTHSSTAKTSLQRSVGNQTWQARHAPPVSQNPSPQTKPSVQPNPLPSQYRDPGFSGEASTPPQSVNFRELGSGLRLPNSVRTTHEAQLGHALSNVRIHTENKAAALAEGLNADAFAFGNHIVFGQSRYQPTSNEGKGLLTHELQHTIQQAPGGPLGRSRIQRQQRATQWGSIADVFLQGLQVTPQLRSLVISALREENRVNGTRPSDFQLILSAGVVIRPAPSNTRSLARYGSATRLIEVGLGNQAPDAALITSLANALFHAYVDVSNDRTLPGSIWALPRQGQQRVLSERIEREHIISDMFRDMSPQPAAGASRFQLRGGGGTTTRTNLREQLLIALRAFSLGQLNQLRDAGVRLWRINQGVPPNYDVSPCTQAGARHGCVNIPTTDSNYRRLPRSVRGTMDIEINPGGGGIAAYQPHFRLVYLKRGDNQIHSGHLRHELAHAYDDIRNNRGTAQRLDDLNDRRRRALILQLAVNNARDQRLRALTRSQATRGQIRQELGRPSQPIFHTDQSRSGITQMYTQYIQGLPRRSRAFDGTARQGHSTRDAQEFYAEGFNVFHGRNEDAQARLLTYAPELYNLLEQEGQAAGRPLPSRSQLQAYIQQNQREFPPRRP